MALPLETFWMELLSRVPERITAAWVDLSEQEQVAVKAHLHRMHREEGWTLPQRESAAAALQVIEGLVE